MFSVSCYTLPESFIYLPIRFQINIQMSDQKQWHYIHQQMSQDLKRKINAFCSEKNIKHKPSCERVEGRIAGDIGSSPPPFLIIRYNLMEMCWQELPMLRPDFVNISKRLRSFIEGEVSNKTFSRCYFFLFFMRHA